MPIEFILPAGFELAGLEQIERQTLWRAYLRPIGKLHLHGERGRTPQEAIDKVFAHYQENPVVEASIDLSLDDLDFDF
jgi:hypothetical protein